MDIPDPLLPLLKKSTVTPNLYTTEHQKFKKPNLRKSNSWYMTFKKIYRQSFYSTFIETIMFYQY